jgi:hypothetical protein
MTVTLDLVQELEERLTEDARRQGLSVNEAAVQVLEKHLPPRDRRTEALRVLQSWVEERGGGEEPEAGEDLLKALDEDRLSDRRLFPPELKGVTW